MQCRVVYLPSSYLYAAKFSKPINPLLQKLREEIYVRPYSEIKFTEYRDTIASSDMKKPPSRLLRLINALLRTWETYIRPTWLVERAAKRTRVDTARRREHGLQLSCPCQ